MSHGPALQACLDSINEREESNERHKKGERKERERGGERPRWRKDGEKMEGIEI